MIVCGTTLFLFIALLLFAVGYTYALNIVEPFSIQGVIEQNDHLYVQLTPAANAKRYKIYAYDQKNQLIYQKESHSNQIDISDLYGNYKDVITFKANAENKKSESIPAQNEYQYVFTNVSFGKESEHYNEKGKDFIIGLDGEMTKNDQYSIDIMYDKVLLKNIVVQNNIVTISHEILDHLSGRVELKLKKKNRVVNVFTIYANSQIVGNIKITNLKEGEYLKWDDFTLQYEGGIHATTLQVNLYKDGVLENTYKTDYTKDGISLPAQFFKENSTYLLELEAIYKDYFEIAKKVAVTIHVGEKETVKPVYVDYNYKNIKKGSRVSLLSNTPDAMIYYTIDGSDPSTSSYLYKEPFTITNDVTIKAFAIRKNMYDSPINTYNFHVDNKPLVVYLSPSNQYDNYGVKAAGYTTEKKEMNKVADLLEKYLKSYGVKVYRNVPSAGINAWISESNYLKSDLHLAIHSNASESHEAHGIEMFVSKETSPSLSIANAIYNQLYEIYPYKDDFSNRGIKYSGESLGEANDAFLPCGTLIEIAYHDNYNDAKWIVEHREDIAKTIGDAILKYYQVI